MIKILTKYFAFLTIILGAFSDTFAQNLVPNPSFEDINYCVRFHAPCNKEAWKNEWGGKFDYLEDGNPFRAHTGSVTAFVKPWHSNLLDRYRHFLQVPLICPLQKGYKYKVGLYIKPKFLAVTELGIWFSDSVKCDRKTDDIASLANKKLFAKTPQIKIKDPKGIYSRQVDPRTGERKWLRIEYIYTSQGFERVMFIGSFQKISEVEVFPLPNDTISNHSFYLIDDVSITPIDSNAIADCCFEANLKAIYDDNYRHSCPDPMPDYWTCYEDSKIKVGKAFVMENINFKPNKAELLDQALPELDSLANYLLENPSLFVQINGHTDSVGTYEYNMQLSQERAETVKDYLAQKGIDPTRLVAKGYGFTRPVATNKTNEGRKKNRRVEFLLTE